MTNAEKYLTVSTKEFENAIINTQGDIEGLYSLEKWLETEAKPTLTEDERVILRNIDKKFLIIGRDEDSLYLAYNNIAEYTYNFEFYNNLFQFIKERRRI